MLEVKRAAFTIHTHYFMYSEYMQSGAFAALHCRAEPGCRFMKSSRGPFDTEVKVE